MNDLGAGWDRDRVNAEIRYHSEIALALTAQRTALESALIPVTAYILVACVECYRRYPEMLSEIAPAVSPEELGRAGHGFGTQIDNVHLWAIPNFVMIGRKVLASAGMIDWDEDLRRMATVFDFWDRAARAYRFDDGTRQAWDAAGVATPYRDQVGDLAAQCRRVDDGGLGRVTRLNALLTSYLFLLWFDTRSGYQDTGPYLLDDGRVLLLRAFNGLGPSHFPWSADVAGDMPYSDVLAAFVLDRVDLHVTDFGTSVTEPGGLSLARGRVRAVRRRFGGRGRSKTAVPTRSPSRPRPRNAGCTARSRAWSAGPRSTRARTCTSRFSGRSPSSRAWPSTGRFRVTAPTSIRSWSSSRAGCRAGSSRRPSTPTTRRFRRRWR